MSARRPFGTFAALLISGLLLGCTTGHENVRLAAGQSNPERRHIAPPAQDRPIILMAFSGGGARAAALAAAVLSNMANADYSSKDGRHNLTDDVALVSSVSGGSVTSAWFGLYGAGRLGELRTRFLSLNNMRTIEGNLVDPTFWVREAFTPYSRIDALETLFDRQLFNNLKLSEVNQPNRPFSRRRKHPEHA